MSEIYRIDRHTGGLAFPHPSNALTEPNGLLAVGGDLRPQRLLSAYYQGIFPWYSDGQPILWWSPDPRCVLYPDRLRINRSLHRALRDHPYRITTDVAFSEVISACATPRRGQEGTWITDELREAFYRLHRMGFAHSVEIWHKERLVGGVYGLSIGSIFVGESMFHYAANASKIALVALLNRLRDNHYVFLDCQISSPHLLALGAEEISRNDYLAMLGRGASMPASWNP